MDENRELSRELEKLNAEKAVSEAKALYAGAVEIGAVKLVTKVIEGSDAASLRGITDALRDTDASVAAVLAAVTDGKVVFVACAGKEAVKHGAHAGNLLKIAAGICGGGGGGRPDSASAGGRDASKLPEAMDAVAKTLQSALK